MNELSCKVQSIKPKLLTIAGSKHTCIDDPVWWLGITRWIQKHMETVEVKKNSIITVYERLIQ